MVLSFINHCKKTINKDCQHEFKVYSYFKFHVYKHENAVTPVNIDNRIYVLAGITMEEHLEHANRAL